MTDQPKQIETWRSRFKDDWYAGKMDGSSYMGMMGLESDPGVEKVIERISQIIVSERKKLLEEVRELVEGIKTDITPEQVVGKIQSTYHRNAKYPSTNFEKMSKKSTKAYWSVKSHNKALDTLLAALKTLEENL